MTMLTAASVLKWAMEIEKNGEAFYSAVAAQSTDPEVKSVFEDMAAQEQGHYKVFKKMLDQVKPHPDLSDIGYKFEEYQSYLQAALSNALFAGPEKGAMLARKAQDRETALQAAIGFEKDTLLFFYDLREMVSEAHRQTVSAVILEEKKHLRRLAKML